MAEPFRREFIDFSGGLALSRSPGTLSPTELRVLTNYIIGPKGELMTRPPLLRAATEARPAEIYHLNIINGEQSGSAWGLLVGDDSSNPSYFKFTNTSTLTELTDKVSSASFDPYPNVSSLRYKKIYYVFGDGMSNAFSAFSTRCDTIAVIDGGDSAFDSFPMQAPTAPTVAPAAGGALPAANYYCVVTFYNSRTGTESPAGTVSAVVTTAAANLQIAWTGIPTPTAGSGQSQVNSRRLWRTLPNQTNEYYLVGTLADRTTTVFTDNVAVASMGARVSTDPGLATGSSGGPALWRERYWLPASISAVGVGTTINAVAYSKPGLTEGLASDGFILVGASDSSDVVACSASDDYLVVFKYLTLWRVTGTGPNNFRVDKIKAPAGLADTYAHAAGPPGIFFLGSDGYFYLTNGYTTQNISERLGRLDLHTGNGASAGITGTQVQSIVWPGKNWFMTVVYAPSSSNTPTGSTSEIYVFDYAKNAWMYWSFVGGATRPRPRSLNLGYNSDTRSPRMYVAGQTDANAFINYFDDDLFESADNNTDLLCAVGETDIVDTPSAPLRNIRTKDFDAIDFGLTPGSAFIVRQVFARIEWPTSIESSILPDTSWQLYLTFTLYGNTNTDVTDPDDIATTAMYWSTEDRANGQWHAIGLSSQQRSVTSIGLEIASAIGGAPRRHSITGLAFEIVPTSRTFTQAGQMLTSNITGSISGTVTGGAGGTAYLCPTDTTVPNSSQVIGGGGSYSFTGLPPGEYLIIVTDAGNNNSATATVTIVLGEAATKNFASLNIPSGSSGCPIA